MKMPFYTTNRIVRITLFWLCLLFLSLIMVGFGQLIQLRVNSTHLLHTQQIKWVKNDHIKTVMVDDHTAQCVYADHEKISFNPENEKARCAVRIGAYDLHQSIEEAQQHLVPAWPLSIIMNTHKDKEHA